MVRKRIAPRSTFPGRGRLIEQAGLDPADGIIDAGGGASRLVDHLLDRGFSDVTVLDLAHSALAHARRRLGERAEKVTWVEADATAWRPQRTYRLWHDRAVFHFLTEVADRDGYLQVLTAALAPCGCAVIATFGPAGPERCSGLPVVRYSPESLQETLGPGFRLVTTMAEEHRTPRGKPQDFVGCLFARERTGPSRQRPCPRERTRGPRLSAEIGLGLLAGMRKTGNPPDRQAAPEQLVYLLARKPGIPAYPAHGQWPPQPEKFFPDIFDHLPMPVAQGLHAFQLADSGRQLGGPDVRIPQEAVFVKQVVDYGR